jgi:hypothetical protein
MLPLIDLLIPLMERSLELQGIHSKSDVAFVNQVSGMEGPLWHGGPVLAALSPNARLPEAAAVFPVVYP